jgi:hypothetical protein
MWIWQYLKDHDAPNWFAIIVSVAWPLGVWLFAHRRVQGVPHLVVNTGPGVTGIGDCQYPAINFEFKNRTRQTVYISQARFRENATTLPVPPAAARDIATGWREIKFRKGAALIDEEIILETGASAWTQMALSGPLPKGFESHRPNWIWIRRQLRMPKYYLLQYTVMVGEQKYSVLTVF